MYIYVCIYMDNWQTSDTNGRFNRDERLEKLQVLFFGGYFLNFFSHCARTSPHLVYVNRLKWTLDLD